MTADLLGLGAQIRARREARGWSIETAAERAGIGERTWRRAEHGHRVRPATVHAIARTVGLPDAALSAAIANRDEIPRAVVLRALGERLNHLPTRDMQALIPVVDALIEARRRG